MAAVRSMQNDNLCYFYTILCKGYLLACCMLQDIFVDFLPTILKFSSVWSTRNRIMRFFFSINKRFSSAVNLTVQRWLFEHILIYFSVPCREMLVTWPCQIF